MPIGELLYICALLMLPFASLEPLLKRLGLPWPLAAFLIFLGLAAALLPPVGLSEELSISLSLPYCAALAFALMCASKRHKSFALLAAALGGVLAEGAKLFLPPLSFEPGLLPGLLAASGAFIAGRNLKTRLSGALLAPVIAHFINAALELSSFSHISPVLGGGTFFDEAAVSFFAVSAAALLAEHARERGNPFEKRA